MLYYIFNYLDEAYNPPGSGMFQYISLRAAASIILALLIVIIFGRKIIDFLRRKQIGEEVRDLGLRDSSRSAAPPTMGRRDHPACGSCSDPPAGRLDNIYIQLMIVTDRMAGADRRTGRLHQGFPPSREGPRAVSRSWTGRLASSSASTMCLSQEIVVRDEAYSPARRST